MKESLLLSDCQYYKPITIHLLLSLFQYVMTTDCFQLGYNEEGHCKGEVDSSLPRPQRLTWDITAVVQTHILMFKDTIYGDTAK